MRITTNCYVIMHVSLAFLFILVATPAIADYGINNSSISRRPPPTPSPRPPPTPSPRPPPTPSPRPPPTPSPRPPPPPSSPPPAPPPAYHFVVSWKTGFCILNTCKLVPTKPPPPFPIHGLWPVEVPGCTDSTLPFNYQDLATLPKLSQLRQYWPNLRGQISEDKFWQHEWNNHGRKCNRFDSVGSYFTASVDLYEQVKMNLDRFAEEPVRSTRKTAALVREWDRWVNNKPFVVCRKDKSNQNYLTEFRFCLDDKKQFINCENDGKQRNLCSEKFEYTKQSMSFVGQLENLMEAMPIS